MSVYNNISRSAKLVPLLAVAMALTLSAAFAQRVRVPLPVERATTVYDEMMKPLDGFGGDLVHVLAADNGEKFPPNPFTGEPDPRNAILFTTMVGAGVNPDEMAGSFMTAIIPRPSVPFFVRAYNAPAAGDATFYEDSDIYTPLDTTDAAFYPQMTATTNPINSGLSPDGLTVSMKEALGLNPYLADSDGDGISDAMELRMGTDALSAANRMPPVIIYADEHDVVNAVWDVSAADEAIMQAAGLDEAQQAELMQLFGSVPYMLEKSESLGASWSEVEGSSGAVHQGWPALPETTEGLQYIRMRMNP